MINLSSHEAGGAWPGGVSGPCPPGLRSASLFGNGQYSGNIIQGGSVLQPQTYTPAESQLSFTSASGSQAHYSNYTPDKAFDGNYASDTGIWIVQNPVNGLYIQADISGGGRLLTKYRLYSRSDYGGARMFQTWTLEGWDGIQWVVLDSRAGQSIPISGGYNEYTVSNATLVSKIRLTMSNFQDASWLDFGDMAVWGRPFGTIQNTIVITGAATVAPDSLLNIAYCQGNALVVDGASASLTASTACKGLFALFKSGIYFINGAGASMTAKGVFGQVLADPSLLDLIPAIYAGKIKRAFWNSIRLARDGAAGSPARSGGSQAGGTGTSGGAWQSGGGGSGAVLNSGTSGAGALGTCFSGGAGGGGVVNSEAGVQAGTAYGGKGGNGGSSNSAAGGAGNPGGTGPGGTGGTGTGGLLLLAAPVVSIGSGCVIQADGVNGGNCVHSGGGGSGGGIVGIIHGGSYTNSGTVRANGGPGGTSSSGVPGGAGGAGSVNIALAS